MSSGSASFKTNDWQWFLQDIDAQLELQMHPDQNEIERHQLERGGGSRSRPTTGGAPIAKNTSSTDLSGSSKELLSVRGRGGYGTFFDVHRTGTVNGKDDDEEMPILSSKKAPPPPKAR